MPNSHVQAFNEQHVLDWYHIARRFEAIGKGLVYLPHIEDFEYRLSRHWHHLNRAKSKVWHGNVYGASIALSTLQRHLKRHGSGKGRAKAGNRLVALSRFDDGVDIHVMIAEADSGRSSVVEQVRERSAELWSCLTQLSITPGDTTKAIAYRRHGGNRPWTNWWTGGWRRSSICAGPNAARRCCSTRAVRYSTVNWGNIPLWSPSESPADALAVATAKAAEAAKAAKTAKEVATGREDEAAKASAAGAFRSFRFFPLGRSNLLLYFCQR